MTSPLPAVNQQPVDLTGPPALVKEADWLNRFSPGRSRQQTLDALTAEEDPRERNRRLGEIVRKMDPDETVEILKTAGKLAVREQPAGLRMLLGFLEVKRPGVEVLRQVETLNSLERVSLRLVGGGRLHAERSGEDAVAYAVLEVLEEATQLGIVDLGLEVLPRKPEALQSLYRHIRGWFRNMELRLEHGEKLKPDALNFIAHLAILEIDLMEKRVSHLAGIVDPYDVRGMGRLMPVLSRYDQDIEHMKNVVSRLTTYQPFYERMLTVEHILSTKETDKLERLLFADPLGEGLGRILQTIRANPILDRELIFLVSLVHQIWVLRSQIVGGPRPDVLSVLYDVLEKGRGGTGLAVALEPNVADEIWPTLQTWGVLRRGPDRLEVNYREERALDFIHPDGTPKLPERPQEREVPDLNLKELVRMQLNNEAFILGILDNPKATALPGLVPMIVSLSRSLRVLDRVMRDRSLYTGPANKEVPRMLLASPARLPLNSLKRFIHVRFVSRLDLERLGRSGSDVRSEVRREIQRYLTALKR